MSLMVNNAHEILGRTKTSFCINLHSSSVSYWSSFLDIVMFCNRRIDGEEGRRGEPCKRLIVRHETRGHMCVKRSENRLEFRGFFSLTRWGPNFHALMTLRVLCSSLICWWSRSHVTKQTESMENLLHNERHKNSSLASPQNDDDDASAIKRSDSINWSSQSLVKRASALITHNCFIIIPGLGALDFFSFFFIFPSPPHPHFVFIASDVINKVSRPRNKSENETDFHRRAHKLTIKLF